MRARPASEDGTAGLTLREAAGSLPRALFRTSDSFHYWWP